ncbi:MAG: hypothetical protein IJ925_07375 [Muribaculaceae bacterium]|nr:hypothetical protein [Muribaculaceae bacterium]
MDCLLNGAPNDGDYQFGNEVNGISDFAGIGSTDNYFIAGQSSSGFTAANGVFTTSIHYSNDQCTWFIGPQVIVRTEPITLEALTHADHNVKHQYHTIDHDLVGVGVRQLYAQNGSNPQTFLIARSVLPISNEYKHQMAEGKTLLRDAYGNVPSWANPETPQYAWIGLKIDNPEDYVGHQFSGVRGIYVYDDGFAYNLLRYNPVMEVIGTPTIKKDAEGNKIEVGTQLNTYSCANLSEQDQSKFFFMEPRLLEICNVVDIMRSDDQKINVPDRTAILPDGMSENIYVDNNITGHAGITDRSYNMWSKCDMETFKVSQESDALAQAWRMRNKVYHVDGALVVASAFQDNAYPLDIPNLTYENFGNVGIGMHIQGEAKLDQYAEDMWVGNGDYWSRYNFAKNKNAYRNDLKITVYNPTLEFKGIGNLEIQRCDHEGNYLETVGTIEQNQWNPGTFTVHYTDAAKEAVNDEGLKQILTPVYADNKQYDLQWGTEKIMGLSDMFYSDEMTSREANTALYPGFQYRVVPAEGNNNTNFKCVVSFAPVFKTNKNVVTRATYSQADVDGDINNTLKENNEAKITFAPNMSKDMTEYRVLKGVADATTGSAFEKIAHGAINVDQNGLMNPVFTDQIVDGTVYVPELYTKYNDNTYGCYKQSVSDASVELNVKSIVAADFTNDENGTRYIHAAIDLSSVINNTDKDSRYLLRVWRQVGNGEKVLLNDQEEAWETNYKALRYLGMDEDKFSKTNPSKPFTLYDTFEASTTTNAAHGLKAGETVNIEDVTYYATLYVKDDASGKYYVKQSEELKPETTIPTAISTVNANAQVESVRYYNVSGIESSKPFAGINFVVTRYSDGTTTTTKMIR